MITFTEYGHTNDTALLDAARAWRDAAIADGWEHRPSYYGEEESRACSLGREGWVASVITREATGRFAFSADVNVWGPDGLAIAPVPVPYDFAAMVAMLTSCRHCGAVGVKTVRYSFAGRCCGVCLPEMRRLYEKPGWDN